MKKSKTKIKIKDFPKVQTLNKEKQKQLKGGGDSIIIEDHVVS